MKIKVWKEVSKFDVGNRLRKFKEIAITASFFLKAILQIGSFERLAVYSPKGQSVTLKFNALMMVESMCFHENFRNLCHQV